MAQKYSWIRYSDRNIVHILRSTSFKKNDPKHLRNELKIFLTQTLLKVTISQKLRVAQKISFKQKMSVRQISIYPANLASFEESWIFGHLKRPFWTPVASTRDMMCIEILRPSLKKLVRGFAPTPPTGAAPLWPYSRQHHAICKHLLTQRRNMWNTYVKLRFLYTISYISTMRKKMRSMVFPWIHTTRPSMLKEWGL